MSLNVSIDLERHSSTLDPVIRREITISSLVAAGVDLDLICLQGFPLTDFKGMVRRLPSFHGFISPQTGCAILARKNSFGSLHFEDHDGAVHLEAVPTNSGTSVHLWSVDHPESIKGLQSAPSIVAGTIESESFKEFLKSNGFIDALRKVGNFEPTRPFEDGPSITDYIFVYEAKPISGDVDDNHLWNDHSEYRRIEAVLNKYGGDHLPTRLTVRV